jgi:FKBP-type peptidyl-prolyl cis-trans isomerase 2
VSVRRNAGLPIAVPAIFILALQSAACTRKEVTGIVIEDGKRVSMEYTLKLSDGSVVESNVGREPLTFQQGDHEILPALEAALAGLAVDESKQVSLSAEQGYGLVDPAKLDEVEIDRIPEESRFRGAMLMTETEEGQSVRVRVLEVKEKVVVIDYNHFLAGQDLNFDLRILAIE